MSFLSLFPAHPQYCALLRNLRGKVSVELNAKLFLYHEHKLRFITFRDGRALPQMFLALGQIHLEMVVAAAVVVVEEEKAA